MRPSRVVGDELAQTGCPVAEVEGVEPLLAFTFAARDHVERLFHRGREVVVDEVREVLFEQVRDRERRPRGHERGALAPDVAARLDRLDDRGVRRRPADTALLELLHEARFGVARRRLGLVADGCELGARRRRAFDDRRQARLALDLVVFVDVFDVRASPAEEVVRLARGPERHLLTVRRRRAEADGHLPSSRVDHLAGDRAHPDQLVETVRVTVELAAHLFGAADLVARGPDGFVRFLRVLDLAAVRARLVGKVVVAVLPANGAARGGDRLLRQVRAVGSHVRDVALFVQPLGDGHRARRGEPKLPARLLLQCRGREGRARSFVERIRIHARDPEGDVPEPRREALGRVTVEEHDVAAIGELTRRGVEVATFGETAAVELDERRAERELGIGGREEGAFEVVPRARTESHPGAFAFDDHPHRDALDAAGRRGLPAPEHSPQDRRRLPTHDAVEDAARFLRLDELHVEFAGLIECLADRVRRDLVEHHALHRDRRLQHFEHVPADRFALAVLVGREDELVGTLQARASAR